MPGMGQVIYDRGIEQGRAEGRAKVENILFELIEAGDIPIEKVAARLDMTEEQLKEEMRQRGYLAL